MLHSASVSKASENILLSSEQGSEVSAAQSCWHFETPWTTVLCRGARPLCPKDSPGKSTGVGSRNLNSFTWYAEDSSFQFPSVFTDSLLSLLEPWFLPGFSTHSFASRRPCMGKGILRGLRRTHWKRPDPFRKPGREEMHGLDLGYTFETFPCKPGVQSGSLRLHSEYV